MNTRFIPVLGILAAAGCGENPDRGPVTIALGEDACDHCRMIISEAAFAAEARYGPGPVEKFDDIGCLGKRLSNGAAPVEAWVTDRATGMWIDAPTAYYVQGDGLQTPMASGLAAFASRAAAEAFAGRVRGRVVSFADITGTGKSAASSGR